MKKTSLLILLLFLLSTSLGFWQISQAYQIQNLSDTSIEGDIVLGPTKIELFLDPGEKATREIMVTNRTGSTINFEISLEDFKGSRDPVQSIVLMGEERGPYSLKDWLKPEIEEFTLDHGQRIHLPIEISVPPDAEPGGRYGVVFALTKPVTPEGEAGKEKTEGQVAIISRFGTLLFIRIGGEVEENGFLKEIKTPQKYYESGPISLQLFFENNGSVHLNPYGVIEIFNILGKKVEEIEVDPYFAMPDSLRLREMEWSRNFLFGKYKAVASINRGYSDIIDQKSINFWVIPWKIVLGGLAGFILLILLILLFRWIKSKFEIRRKTTP